MMSSIRLNVTLFNCLDDFLLGIGVAPFREGRIMLLRRTELEGLNRFMADILGVAGDVTIGVRIIVEAWNVVISICWRF